MRAAVVATLMGESGDGNLDEALFAFAGKLDAGIDGCYVATADSGAFDAVSFWEASLETGLAMANPRAFPKTLANSSTATLTKRLGVRGPTYTVLGGGDAVVAAAVHGLSDLAEGVVRRALLAGIDADGTVAGMVLVGGDGPITCSWTREPPELPASVVDASPAATIAALINDSSAGEPVVTGTPRNGWLTFAPGLVSVRCA